MINFEDKISVIVPFRNVKPYIEDCLESIKNQTYTNFEVILLDDASDDGSELIAEQYAKDDKRFLYNRLTKQKSIAAIRNIGLERANGKYIAWCDSDDIVSKDWLLILYTLIKENNCQLSICSYKKTKNRNARLDKYKENLHTELYSAVETQKICLSSNKIGGFLTTKMFVADIAKKIRFYENLKACEDLTFVIEYLDLIENVCRTPKKLYLYFIRKNSLCHDYQLQKMLNFVLAMNLIVKNSKDKPYYYHAVIWRAMTTCMPIILSYKHLKSKKGLRFKMLFAKYFEQSKKIMKEQRKKEHFSFYTKFVISFYNFYYKRYLIKVNKLLKKVY